MNPGERHEGAPGLATCQAAEIGRCQCTRQAWR
jgi:hypothetical protein